MWLRVVMTALPSVSIEALIARGDRLQVAVVRDRKLHFVDVDPGATDAPSRPVAE